MGYKIEPEVRRVLLAQARFVAAYHSTWQANIEGCKRDGKDPGESGSVKESFAHYVAGRLLLIEGCTAALSGEFLPKLQGESRGEAFSRHACALADELTKEAETV